MDYVGIDLHKKESQICILSRGGELSERRIRTEPQRFAAVLGERPRVRILLEASTESEWVARCLEGLGHEVVVADPNFAPMYATRTRKVKTDRRDARALAEACLLGAYRPAHRLSDPQRHVRGRLAVRDALVRTRTRYLALIRALLRRHGWRVPTGSAETFSRRVVALPLPGRLLSEVAPLLAVMRHINQQLAYSDEVIETVTRPDVRVQRLRTVPSVGPVTAAAFVATIDEVQRFRRAQAPDESLAVYQFGDYLDLWRQGSNDARPILEEHYDIHGHLYGSPSALNAWFLLGNHDVELPSAGGYEVWNRRYYFPIRDPRVLITHGDVFDWKERFPDAFNRLFVYMFGPMYDSTAYDLEPLQRTVRASHGRKQYRQYIQADCHDLADPARSWLACRAGRP